MGWPRKVRQKFGQISTSLEMGNVQAYECTPFKNSVLGVCHISTQKKDLERGKKN